MRDCRAIWFRVCCCMVSFFVFWSAILPELLQAQSVGSLPAVFPAVPAPGVYYPLTLKGLKVYPADPLRFDLIVDKGSSLADNENLRGGIARLSQFLLASLAVPDQDMWVNLSPDGRDRVMPETFARTEMGKVLMEQDYLLKQKAASLTYPETSLGAAFWKEVYGRVFAEYGTTDIPAGNINKVWIIPSTATVYTRNNSVFVTDTSLDVLTDTDYQLLQDSQLTAKEEGVARIYTDVFRQMILPVLRRDVNGGELFAPVRQVYNALVLATWYKRHQAATVVGTRYVGQNKVRGIDSVAPALRQEIFERYLRSVEEGVYSYIKEENDPVDAQMIPRKYFSGGVMLSGLNQPAGPYRETQLPLTGLDGAMSSDLLRTPLQLEPVDQAMLSSGLVRSLALGVTLAMAPVAMSHAAAFAPSSDGKATVVELKPGETYGHAVQRIRTTYKRLNPEGYKHSGFYGSMWGKDGKGGVVKTLGGDQADPVAPYRPLVINAVLPEEVLRALPALSVPVKQAPAVIPVTVPDRGGDQKELTTQPPASSTVQAPAAAVAEPSFVQPAREELAGFTSFRQYLIDKVKGGVSGMEWPEISLRDPRVYSLLGGLLFLGGAFLFGKKRTAKQQKVLRTGTKAPMEPEKDDPTVVFRDEVPPATTAGQGATVRENAAELLADARPAVSRQGGNENAEILSGLHELEQDDATGEILAAPVEGKPEGNSRQAKPAYAVPLWARGLLSLLTLGWFSVHTFLVLSAGAAATQLAIPALLAMTVLGVVNASALSHALVRCGIEVRGGRIAPQDNSPGVVLKTVQELMPKLESEMRTLEARGGQALGLALVYSSDGENSEAWISKMLKPKRWLRWEKGTGPVFAPDLIGRNVKAFIKGIPAKAKAIDNLGRAVVVFILNHTRFATGGVLVKKATHPHASREEEVVMEAFDENNVLRRIWRKVMVVIGHNGDNDNARMGGGNVTRMFGQTLDTTAMRRVFPALLHHYFQGEVTASYLKADINPLLVLERGFRPDYRRIVKELRRRGYIVNGRVSPKFAGVDDDFRAQFNRYPQAFFNHLDSALFGLPPGDSPIIPFQIHLFLAQGIWKTAVRYAHVFANHSFLSNAMEDLLSEREEEALGEVFRQEMDRKVSSGKTVLQLLSRPGYKPAGRVKELSDLWFDSRKQAAEAGVEAQYDMLLTVRDRLAQRLARESGTDSEAGRVLARMERGWRDSKLDVEAQRLFWVAVVMKKYFTGSREQAVREFAKRADGTYGIFVQTTAFADGVTVFNNGQDVAVGLDHTNMTFGASSDSQTLKTPGPNGEKYDEIVHLQDGQVMNLTYDQEGKFDIRSWKDDPLNKGWLAVPDEELRGDFYSTQEMVDGKKNPRHAPPPVQYKKESRIVPEELSMSTAVVADANERWNNADSDLRKAASRLARQLREVKAGGKEPRLLVVGYDDSFIIPSAMFDLLYDLVDGLKIETVSANQFVQSFERHQNYYRVDENTMALVVSKSGATSPTKTATKALKALAGVGNVYAMTSRADAMVLDLLRIKDKPADDPENQRFFLTGTYFFSEAPTASEIQLMYHSKRLVYQLAEDLTSAGAQETDGFYLRFAPEKFQEIKKAVADGGVDTVRAMTGTDEKGDSFSSDVNKELTQIGKKIGLAMLRPWVIDRVKDLIVLAVFLFGGPLTLLYMFSAGPQNWYPDQFMDYVVRVADFIFINYALKFFLSETYSKIAGLSSFGRTGARKIFIVGPKAVGELTRNYYSRLWANGTSGTSPSAIYEGDSLDNFVSRHASDVGRGDIILNFVPVHDLNRGRMSVRQVSFPNTGAFFGLGIWKGSAVVVDVPVYVPKGADPDETAIIESSLGLFSILTATKVVGSVAAMRSSLGGRLWMTAKTWSRAGVHTTPTPWGETHYLKELLKGKIEEAEYVRIREGHLYDEVYPEFAKPVAAATLQPGEAFVAGSDASEIPPQDKTAINKDREATGGIDLDGRRIDLKETGEALDAFPEADLQQIPIDGFIPHIGVPVPIAPAMTLSLLTKDI